MHSGKFEFIEQQVEEVIFEDRAEKSKQSISMEKHRESKRRRILTYFVRRDCGTVKTLTLGEFGLNFHDVGPFSID